jgi:hypothetical protein
VCANIVAGNARSLEANHDERRSIQAAAHWHVQLRQDPARVARVCNKQLLVVVKRRSADLGSTEQKIESLGLEPVAQLVVRCLLSRGCLYDP